MRTQSRPLSGHSCVSRLFLAVIFPRQPSCAPSTRAAYGKLASHGGGLAHSVISLNGCLIAEELSSLPDEEFIAALTAISGIGPWTALGALLIALQQKTWCSWRPGVTPGRAERLADRPLAEPTRDRPHSRQGRPYRSQATSYVFSGGVNLTRRSA